MTNLKIAVAAAALVEEPFLNLVFVCIRLAKLRSYAVEPPSAANNCNTYVHYRRRTVDRGHLRIVDPRADVAGDAA
jgi:hypothetical protein